jgi:hypothetical protein
MSLPDEEFDVLGKDELALLTRRFERMHDNRVNSRNSRTCFKCGKTRHFFAECPKVNNRYKHKSKDKGEDPRRSMNMKGRHRPERRSRDRALSTPSLRTRRQARVTKKNRVTRRRKRRTSAST